MPRSKPIIGLSTYLELARWASWDTEAAIIQKKYLDTVELADARPILLPPLDSDLANEANHDEISEAVREVIDIVDGVVLIGGGDVDSSIYGQEPNPYSYGVSPKRDAWEISLTKACIEMDKPLLGICRGMQIINIALGGTLDQHIPDLVNTSNHSPGSGLFGEIEVHFEMRSKMDEVFGKSALVQCRHHQAVSDLGKGLSVTGRSDDGVIHSIEGNEGLRYLAGVQWHPEQSIDSRLITSLIKGAKI